jgi:phosphohistidine phosphatase
MRTLLVLRHAKSDWDVGGGDHERPLAKRGRKAAARVGRFIAIAGPRPDLVVTSTAIRARDTAARAARAGGWTDVPVHATEALYETTVSGALAVIRALPDEAETVLIVGHEPTFSDLVGGLVGGGCVEMATGSLATVKLDAERWEDADLGPGVLDRLIPARSLDGLRLGAALKRRVAAGAHAGDHDQESHD